MTGDLRIERDGDVVTIALNRADRGNRLSAAMVEALHSALDDIEHSGGRALILRSDGGNFCTGFDLSDAVPPSDGDLLLRFVRIEQLLARLWQAPYVTIAICQGRAIGAGADLVASCHRRLALDGASFAFPGAGFGIVLGTRRLQSLVGSAAALKLIGGGGTMDAAEALAMGFVHKIVGPSELESVIAAEARLAARLDRETQTAILGRLRPDADDLDADLAALVRSAARPGLAARIAQFASNTRKRGDSQ